MNLFSLGIPLRQSRNFTFETNKPKETVEWLIQYADFSLVKQEDRDFVISKTYKNKKGGKFNWCIKIIYNSEEENNYVVGRYHLEVSFPKKTEVDAVCWVAKTARIGASQGQFCTAPYWAILVIPGGLAIKLVSS